MCGLAGFVDFNFTSDLNNLKKMVQIIKYRGPDDEGYEIFQNEHCGIGLGFTRLSIIDLSQLGHQPMFSADRNICAVFNGEIYNHKEIRNELEIKGYKFNSNSDTEIIIKSYEYWGPDCVKQFNGMFAIVLLDNHKKKVFLFRDRLGVKPLYYYYNSGLFLFGSELKCLIQHSKYSKVLNQQAILEYFQYGYIRGTHSIFNGTNKVTPAHYIELDIHTGKFNEIIYWNINEVFNSEKLTKRYDEILEDLELRMIKAFRYRLISDVPVGVFLSGGYDSSAVVGLLQKHSNSNIKTFTIGFDDSIYDESKYAEKVAKHLETDHITYWCKPSDAKELINDFAFYYDEPLADISGIPTMLLSRLVKTQVKAALSADGGDELFAGYKKYVNTTNKIRQLNQILRFTKPLINSKRFINLESSSSERYQKLVELTQNFNPSAWMDVISKDYTDQGLNMLFIQNYKSISKSSILDSEATALNQILLHDLKFYLPDDILYKVDRATMSASLEGREPFLDYELIEFVAKIPDRFKMNKNQQKIILKDIVHKYIPKPIMQRPKMGFNVPFEDWLYSDLNYLIDENLDPNFIKTQRIFNPDYINKLLTEFKLYKKTYNNRMTKLILFQMWYRKWMLE